jgi:hypothetical protein
MILDVRARRRRCDMREPLSPAIAVKRAVAYQGLLQARGEPGAGRLPIALDGDDRYVQRGGDVFLAQPAEKAQLHHAGGSRIDLFERRKEGVQVQQLLARGNVVQDVNAG